MPFFRSHATTGPLVFAIERVVEKVVKMNTLRHWVPIPAISISRSDASRSGIPDDREQCGAGRMTAPLGWLADLSVRLSRQVRRRPSP
jgi:hypothetical protein